MKQFTLAMRKKAQRPIIFLQDFFHLDAMLDTGSVLPVWVEDEGWLAEIGSILVTANQPFGGFGGTAIGTLYRIPLFRCGDLVYPNLPIIAAKINLPCQMLLSATMFSGLIYEVDDCHHRFNVTIPDTESSIRNLRIEDREGTLHVLCTGEDAS